MKVLIIDNFDSFTFNLYQYIGEILSAEQHKKALPHFDVIVKRNNELSAEQIASMDFDRIIISPGPGSPDDPQYFGVCAEVIEKIGPNTPLLGVCLGMQGIVHVFGGNVVKANTPMHGKTSAITHDSSPLFSGIPNGIEIMRYHSLVAEPNTLPECLTVTSEVINTDNTTEIMAIQHKEFPIYGVQYHPESFASEGGKELLKNFLFLQA